jgi:hypothetical protein
MALVAQEFRHKTGRSISPAAPQSIAAGSNKLQIAGKFTCALVACKQVEDEEGKPVAPFVLSECIDTQGNLIGLASAKQYTAIHAPFSWLIYTRSQPVLMSSDSNEVCVIHE